MQILAPERDAFGHQLMDFHHGRPGAAVLERDDGYVQLALDASFFFAARHAWEPYERRAMDAVRGRVLDVGCGAGRHALDLQARGHDVLAIDVSPLALEVCRARGVRRAEPLALDLVDERHGPFDTVLMMCGNFGLLESRDRATVLLERLHTITTPGAVIVADSVDPHATNDPAHLAYHEANRRRGRYAGQVTIRLRYRRYATRWFEYLNVSQEEMAGIVDGTGWRVESVHRDDGSADHAAVLRRA